MQTHPKPRNTLSSHPVVFKVVFKVSCFEFRGKRLCNQVAQVAGISAESILVPMRVSEPKNISKRS